MTVRLEDIQAMVAQQLGRRRVAPEDRILEELGAESLDVVNLIAAVEDRYQIAIEEEEISDIETVEDLYETVRRRVAPRHRLGDHRALPDPVRQGADLRVGVSVEVQEPRRILRSAPVRACDQEALLPAEADPRRRRRQRPRP